MDKRRQLGNASDVTSSKQGPGFHAPSELVTFLIGKEEEPFKIHKEFIVHHSDVLAAAFNNDRFIEGETQTYRLDDVEPCCFRLFVQWVYTQDFDLKTPEPGKLLKDPINRELVKSLIDQDFTLAQLWVLGDKFMIHGLQNKIIDKFVLMHNLSYFYSARWFKYAYENTSDSSPLRRWIIDYSIACNRTGFGFKKFPEFYPKEMLFDLLEKLEEIHPRTKRAPPPPVASEYYV